MKKLLLILLCPILLLTSCSKSGINPQSMEDVIVDKKWWDTTDEDGMLLTEEGDFYYLQVCQQDSLMGTWIIDGDLIKLRFYVNSIEYTALIGAVTSYTDTELKINAETNDPNLQGNYVFTTEFTQECTYIPDNAFERCLIALGYDDELDNYVNTKNIIDIKHLSLFNLNMNGTVSNYEITDLTGIESFINLETLLLSDTTNLWKNTSSGNDDIYHKVSSLDLTHNPKLRALSIGSRSTLTSLDLSNNPLLTHLSASPNNGGGSIFTDLDLSNNPLLSHLSLTNSVAFNLDISNNLLLKKLRLRNCISINLENVNSLKHIDVSSTTNLNLNIENKIELECLHIRDCNIANLNLSSCENLKELVLRELPSLVKLDMRNGNNLNMTGVASYGVPTIYIQNSPTLSCISVDDGTLWESYNNNGEGFLTFQGTSIWFMIPQNCIFSDNCQ